ncbi:MAG: hypothetical protein A2494_01870 [Candidatus Lloydbacteria bacterium RIFOXYC12_FULL_46_25]|uniref:Response regulatory domain-containing protein n=1 Tax=Candidatus Lloydbacteria bacterium RIFOXYC12_FULL_46_25 TaxID=1798670 RepID=A0A1G2DYD6_9BACT|nr:MAG: hypothetical protein A2494_01870 [Candidatus Lloydbacteria bacterium RIFOXYC12_FULL_46_25]
MEKRHTILLVENDTFLNKILVYELVQQNFDVILADNGEAAFERLAERKPDIMILDLMLPVKDGFEVLEEMKSTEVFKDIPVIVLSALSKDENLERALALGAVGYFVKSDISIPALAEKVRGFLEPKE